jgi:hypothetical protein
MASHWHPRRGSNKTVLSARENHILSSTSEDLVDHEDQDDYEDAVVDPEATCEEPQLPDIPQAASRKSDIVDQVQRMSVNREHTRETLSSAGGKHNPHFSSPWTLMWTQSRQRRLTSEAVLHGAQTQRNQQLFDMSVCIALFTAHVAHQLDMLSGDE